MTVFGSKELKAYVILLWSGAVPRGRGGNGALYTVEPRYNEDLGTMKITLL